MGNKILDVDESSNVEVVEAVPKFDPEISTSFNPKCGCAYCRFARANKIDGESVNHLEATPDTPVRGEKADLVIIDDPLSSSELGEQ